MPTVHTIDAVFTGGVFRPLGSVPTAENERVRLTIEPVAATATAEPVRTAADVLRSDLVGLWADRTDIEDSRAFSRRLREQAQTRPGANHAPG